MKKAISLILALVLCLSLCACGHEDNGNDIDPALEDEPIADEKLTSYAFSDFEVLSAADGVAVVKWHDADGNNNRGLMDYEGNVFFKFPEEYPNVNTISDGYIYGDGGIIATNGTLLFQFPEDTDCKIVAYGNDVFMVKQYIANMTENTVKLGFMHSNGSWIVEPSIDVGEDLGACYVDNGYFACGIAGGDLLFVEPNTGHQFSADCIGLKGASDGIAIVSTGLGTAVYGYNGIELQTGTEFRYDFNGSVLSVGEGYVVTGEGTYAYGAGGQFYNKSVCIYNMLGEKILDLSKYRIVTASVSDGCLVSKILGEDKEYYLAVINIETGNFTFEPIKDQGMVEDGNYSCALVHMDDRNCYVNYLDGSFKECDYPASDLDIPNIDKHGDIVKVNTDNYYGWVNGNLIEVVPSATFAQ